MASLVLGWRECLMFQHFKSIIVIIIALFPNMVFAGNLFGSMHSIEVYKNVEIKDALIPYNNWCRENALNDVFLPDIAIQKFGSPELGQRSVRLIDMYYLECPGSINPWEMGHRKQGSGGSEMVLLYEKMFLVRFSAMNATIVFSENGNPTIKADVHPSYCSDAVLDCKVEMEISPKLLEVNQ
jgi:hypothetical protein